MSDEISYKTISPIKLCNALSALEEGLISFRGLRVYLGCFELQAIREAAKRSKRAKGEKGSDLVRFRVEELTKLCSVASKAGIRRELNSLKRANLLQFSSTEITITETPLQHAQELLAATTGKRKVTRPIPVPRRILRFIASSTKPTLVKTLLAHLLRGLSIHKRTGEINSRGTVKASWVAELFSCSIRSVKQARLELIELGIISKDTGSYQRKLNRDGAYFELNVTWGRVEARETSTKDAQPVDNSSSQAGATRHEFAPPRGQTCHEFAPPIERLKTSKEYKNQKARRAEPSGVCKQTLKKEKTTNHPRYSARRPKGVFTKRGSLLAGTG